VHTSSRTTTKAAPHTQCDGCRLLYGYMGTDLSRDRGMDGFRGPTRGAHFVVCSQLILGPKYQILPSMRFWATETPQNRNAGVRNGWMIVSHQPSTVINRWQRGVGARTVVLELTIVVARCGPFGAPPEGQKAKRMRK
jgi:hypothetical protein